MFEFLSFAEQFSSPDTGLAAGEPGTTNATIQPSSIIPTVVLGALKFVELLLNWNFHAKRYEWTLMLLTKRKPAIEGAKGFF